jgi:hypothetical protein
MKGIAEGWIGKTLRSSDGHRGRIDGAVQSGPCLDLYITRDDEKKSVVTLNAWGRDRGDHSWQWYCPEFCHGPAWLPLTDQSPALQFEE